MFTFLLSHHFSHSPHFSPPFAPPFSPPPPPLHHLQPRGGGAVRLVSREASVEGVGVGMGMIPICMDGLMGARKRE